MNLDRTIESELISIREGVAAMGQPVPEDASVTDFFNASSSSCSSLDSSSSSGFGAPLEAYSAAVGGDSTTIAKQLGVTLMNKQTSMWRHELISSLPDEQLNTLVKQDSHIRKINNKTNNMEAQSFPLKLHNMLSDAEAEGFSDVVSWQRGGSSFKVHKPTAFANRVMSRYFKQTKYKSFQRQLNLYGFVRIHQGVNKGGYEHRFFAEERPSLLDSMTRQKFKTKKGQLKAVPKLLKFCTTKKILSETVAVKHQDRAPSEISADLFSAKMDLSILDVADKAQELAGMIITDAGLEDDDGSIDEGELLTNFLLDRNDRTRGGLQRQSSKIFDEVEDNPVLFALLQDSFLTIGEVDIMADVGNDLDDLSDMFNKDHVIPEDRSYVSDTTIKEEPEPSLSSIEEVIDVEPSNGPQNEHSFPWKVHDMLAAAESDGFQDIASWVMEGTAFCVHDQDAFVEKIMPLYFEQTKFESFRRQLNLYCFTRVVRGPFRGSYMHPSFLRNDRAQCRNVKRGPPKSKTKSK